jgi:hypothetical protein
MTLAVFQEGQEETKEEHQPRVEIEYIIFSQTDDNIHQYSLLCMCSGTNANAQENLAVCHRIKFVTSQTPAQADKSKAL